MTTYKYFVIFSHDTKTTIIQLWNFVDIITCLYKYLYIYKYLHVASLNCIKYLPNKIAIINWQAEYFVSKNAFMYQQTNRIIDSLQLFLYLILHIYFTT